MTTEELERGCEAIIVHLPEFTFSDELLAQAVREAVTPEIWVILTDEDKVEAKREIYRALKAKIGVKLEEDRLIREDIESLKGALRYLESGNIEAAMERIREAISY